jgi:hypothetical protein
VTTGKSSKQPSPFGGRGVAGSHHVTALETLDAGGWVSSAAKRWKCHREHGTSSIGLVE